LHGDGVDGGRGAKTDVDARVVGCEIASVGADASP
jgi:hypothetical protein